MFVDVDEHSGRTRATLRGHANPVAALHARTWALGKAPTDDEIRSAYLAAGFPAAQLERAMRRKAKWRELPEVVLVRFPKHVGNLGPELLLAL